MISKIKVIGICGSPRKGNTEWIMVTFLSELSRMGIQTEMIYLRNLNINQCNGCLSCESGDKKRPGICRIKDSMNEIYPRLIEADGFVFGTPVYFEMVSGLLKAFMDRTCAIWPKLEGKMACGIAVAEAGIGKAVDNIRTYCKVCSIDYIGSITTLAKNPKDASKNKAVIRQIKRLVNKFVFSLKS